MATTVILTVCVLVLIAYMFDLSSRRTKIPSVVLLLLTGFVVQQICTTFSISVPELKPLLPVFGTVGLILIVLEGGLDLQLNSRKKEVLITSALSSLIPILILTFGIGWFFSFMAQCSYLTGLINAVPFAVISSAVAIPSAQNLLPKTKEFIIYESSFSDIFGVILFNFFTLSDTVSISTFGEFGLQIVVMLVISFLSSLALAFLIKNISHHVKFIPIIMMIIMIYSISKTFHLPALVFILLFGLFLNNLDELRGIRLIRVLSTGSLEHEISRFREIVGEVTFLVRTIFFLLFGYSIYAPGLLDQTGLYITIVLIISIFSIRFIQLKVTSRPIAPLLFIAPRGLISVLLFLSIPATHDILIINESVIIQVILSTAVILMLGLLLTRTQPNNTPELTQE